MSLPGFPSVIPFIIWQGEKEEGFNILLYLALPLVTPFIFLQGEKGVWF